MRFKPDSLETSGTVICEEFPSGNCPGKRLLLLATTCKFPLYFIDRIILHLLVKQGDRQVRGTWWAGAVGVGGIIVSSIFLSIHSLFSMVRRMGEFISYRKKSKIKVKGQGTDRQTGRQVDK